MRPWVLTCDPATPLVTAAQRLAADNVHALVVLEPGPGGRHLSGVLTAGDVVRCAARLDEMTAGQAATGALLEVGPDERLVVVAKRMVDHDATHAVVFDPAGSRPLGVVSTLDIARILGWGRD
jgi:CBS domain-containing protein